MRTTLQRPPRNSSPDEESGNGSVSHSESDQTHEEILEYWTKQRMADAKPRELRLPEGGPRLMQRGADPAPDHP
ncbi:MAG TPA: hypothetical protein DIT15_06245 [Arthrobacter bacterium]|nr:hypothetical protein [Arthrobacter sp.]HCB58697.1 hypothetical protein [Arthrobacter sp.]HCN21834.1 hypothetical protein [Arthrobacter sp.]